MNLLLHLLVVFYSSVHMGPQILYIKWKMLNRLEISDILEEFGAQFFKCTFSKYEKHFQQVF